MLKYELSRMNYQCHVPSVLSRENSDVVIPVKKASKVLFALYHDPLSVGVSLATPEYTEMREDLDTHLVWKKPFKTFSNQLYLQQR